MSSSDFTESWATYGPYLVPENGILVFYPPEIIVPPYIIEQWIKSSRKRKHNQEQFTNMKRRFN